MLEALTVPGAPFEVLLFAFLAASSIGGAISVVVARDPFISALSLIINFVSLGVLYLMLQAPFVAIAQVIVYAGAVVVLFLFVIAYLGDRRELLAAPVRSRWLLPVGAASGIALAGIVFVVALAAHYGPVARLPHPHGTTFAFGSVRAIGKEFLTRYLLEFEVTSLVLLVAAIGGIVLGLTGRERHRRMRELMHTFSADQQKRRFREGFGEPAAKVTAPASEGGE